MKLFKSWKLLPILAALVGISCLFSPTTQAQGKPIRFLVPKHELHFKFYRELETIIAEYNQSHAQIPTVEATATPGLFSTLQPLTSAQLSKDLPDLAVIETSELPVAHTIFNLQPLPKNRVQPHLGSLSPLLIQESKNEQGDFISLPFLRATPLLIIDQEALFRSYVDPNLVPTFWSQLQKIATTLKQKSTDVSYAPMGLATENEEGLWLFEALLGVPLWERTRGGLKIAEPTKQGITILREWIDSGLLTTNETEWKSLAKDFLNRKVGILVASSDWLPFLTEQMNFRWTAVPLPRVTRDKPHANQKSSVGAGSQLLILNNRPEVWDFVQYLYQPSTLSRLSIHGGFIPLKKAALQTAEWKQFKLAQPKASEILASLRPNRARTTDVDIVKVRGVWAQSLEKILAKQPLNSAQMERVINDLSQELAATNKP